MKLYKRKPIVLEAYQWEGQGPEEEAPILRYKADARILIGKCRLCGNKMMDHGRLVAPEGPDLTVCPGDYIITGVDGNMYPCSPDNFAQLYEEVVEEVTNGQETESA